MNGVVIAGYTPRTRLFSEADFVLSYEACKVVAGELIKQLKRHDHALIGFCPIENEVEIEMWDRDRARNPDPYYDLVVRYRGNEVVSRSIHQGDVWSTDLHRMLATSIYLYGIQLDDMRFSVDPKHLLYSDPRGNKYYTYRYLARDGRRILFEQREHHNSRTIQYEQVDHNLLDCSLAIDDVMLMLTWDFTRYQFNDQHPIVHTTNRICYKHSTLPLYWSRMIVEQEGSWMGTKTDHALVNDVYQPTPAERLYKMDKL